MRARRFLFARAHRLAASQDAGQLLSRRRDRLVPGISADRARRDDLRPAALRDGDAGRRRPRRTRSADARCCRSRSRSSTSTRRAAIFLGSTCTPEILKMNVAGCAPADRAGDRRARLSRAHGRVRRVVHRGRRPRARPRWSQRAPAGDGANLVILGCLSALEEAEIRLECRAMGLPEPAFLPGESALDAARRSGEDTVLAPVHPYLFDACAYAARERGARVPRDRLSLRSRRHARVLRSAGGRVRQDGVVRGARTRGVGGVRTRGCGAARAHDRLLLRRDARTAARRARCCAAGVRRPVRRHAEHLQEIPRARNRTRSKASRCSKRPTASRSSRGSRPSGPISSSRISTSPTRSKAWASTSSGRRS